MKEIELIGETVQEIYEKLENNKGKQVRHYLPKYDRSTILDLISFRKFICPLGEEVVKISVLRKVFSDEFSYELNISPNYPEDKFKLFLLLEDEVSETFDEMVKRKQKDIFRSLK